MTVSMSKPAELSSATCRSCGACCSCSTEWPRFSLESEVSLDQIAPVYVDDERGGMRCNGPQEHSEHDPLHRARRDGSEASGVISLGPTAVRLRERLSETGA